jgi:nitrate reductase gamma subunit
MANYFRLDFSRSAMAFHWRFSSMILRHALAILTPAEFFEVGCLPSRGELQTPR